MADYVITFARSARRELELLDRQIGQRVLAKIEGLRSNPRPAGAVKLAGTANFWRIRMGDWRVIYEIDDTRRLVDVARIRHRSDAYR